MDFRKLMQQASFNQKISEKEYERQRQIKEDEKAREMEEELDKRRRAAEKLRHLDAEAVRKRLVYKGLISDRSPAVHKSQSEQQHTSDSTKSAHKGKPQSASSSSSSKKPPATKNHLASKPSPTSQPKPKLQPKPKPQPMNFQDLMKLAQKNSEQKQQQQQQQKSQMTSLHREQVSLTPPPVGQRKAKSSSPTPVKKLAGKEKQRSYSPAPRTTAGTKMSEHLPHHRKGNGLVTISVRSNSSSAPVRQQVNSDTSIKGKGGVTRGRQQPMPGLNPAKTNSFYGAVCEQLSRDERPRFSTKRPPATLRSSLAGEMSEYMRQMEREGLLDEEEEEEEEDDDFIDDEGDCDYSAAIREIFGYDKRRFNGDDGEVMESSFAQQQFEEKRSARIGKQEDDEDIRREQEELARKRKKGGGGGKQKKLRFI